MIVYRLQCHRDHNFEAWFRNSAAFDAQSGAGTVCCPLCGSKKVTKAPMAPRVAKAQGDEPQVDPKTRRALEVRRKLLDLRRHVEQTCDYVGAEFAENARKIHYGEADHRNIYGETSDQEARDLAEEGVEIQRIPWLPPENS